MAIFSNAVFQHMRGKFGGAITQEWKNIQVVRSMPQSVFNPRTASQTLQRNKFKLANILANKFKPYVKLLFSKEAIKKTEYNALIQSLIRNIALRMINGKEELVLIHNQSQPLIKGSYNIPDECHTIESNIFTNGTLDLSIRFYSSTKLIDPLNIRVFSFIYIASKNLVECKLSETEPASDPLALFIINDLPAHEYYCANVFVNIVTKEISNMYVNSSTSYASS